MLSKLNPTDIIIGHFGTFKNYATGKISRTEIGFQVLTPAMITILHYHFAVRLTESLVSIIVSAASIATGLLLNLLVLVYTLAFNASQSANPGGNIAEFKILINEMFSTISYCVLLCIALIASAFMSISDAGWLSCFGQIVCIYTSTSALLCLLIVLKRCYRIISFELG